MDSFILWIGLDNLGLILFSVFWCLLIVAAGKETSGGLGNQR